MHFAAYLGEGDLLPAKKLTELRDQAAITKSSLFALLYKDSETPDALIPYPELVKYVTEALARAGTTVIELKSMDGLKLDSSVYAFFGGITEKMTERSIPLVRDDGTRIMLTVTPDDRVYREKLYQAYNRKDPIYAVTTHQMWNIIWSTLAEPALLQSMANTVSDINGAKNTEEVQTSEARELYKRLLKVGIQRRASDVKFTPCSFGVKVDFRVDGHYQNYGTLPLDVLDKIINILQTDGNMPIKKPHEPVDGKVRFSPSGNRNGDDAVDLRVSIIPSKQGRDLNIRYLTDKQYTFDDIGMTDRNIELYKHLLDMPSGLVVQVGPTGSGKSTTLYAGLAYLYEKQCNIMTVEDPVEIQMDGITQIDVDQKERLTFDAALTAALRHDPDVIVVGELRDETTAALAVRASNTGHLVLTSLHTNDSIGAFERLINLGIDPYSLGEVIAAVMGQRLVRRLCPKCKEAYELDLKSQRAYMFGLPNKEEKMTFYRAVGCPFCNGTGYRGRIAINEALQVTSEIRNMIQRHALRAEYEKHLKEKKFVTMYQDGMRKAILGITSLEELEPYANDPIAFK